MWKPKKPVRKPKPDLYKAGKLNVEWANLVLEAKRIEKTDPEKARKLREKAQKVMEKWHRLWKNR